MTLAKLLAADGLRRFTVGPQFSDPGAWAATADVKCGDGTVATFQGLGADAVKAIADLMRVMNGNLPQFGGLQ